MDKRLTMVKELTFHAVSNSFVSVTPLQIDLTKYSEMATLSKWMGE